nr:galactose-1-phosphate uridylyltransferase [Candidatus Sigynarchaeota archaeon]
MSGQQQSQNELRWNPFFKKWIIMAPARQNRPVDVKDAKLAEAQKKAGQVPGTEQKKCPFCVGAPEVPETFDVKVLPNRYSGLDIDNKNVFTTLRPGSPYKIAPAIGHQELILYSPNHEQKLGELPVDHITKLVKMLKERYIEVGKMPGIQYIYQFENRGSLIGVSLAHPHGQMYAFSWIPLYVKLELDSFKEYKGEHKRCLLCDIIKDDKLDGVRVIKENDNFIEVAPFFAMWPHEVHLYPKKHIQSFADFDDAMARDFAAILKDLNQRYDRFYPGVEFAFVMAIHQKPTINENFNYYHFHVEFYPPLRAPTMSKFAAGVELGTGAWINSTLPEKTAELMRAIKID